jgi:hypothetical protein
VNSILDRGQIHYGAALGLNNVVWSIARNGWGGGDELHITNTGATSVDIYRPSNSAPFYSDTGIAKEFTLGPSSSAVFSYLPDSGASYGIAIDPSGGVWVANYEGSPGARSKYEPAEGPVCGAFGIRNPFIPSSEDKKIRCLKPPPGNRFQARGLTVDALNRVWVAYNSTARLVMYDINNDEDELYPARIVNLEGTPVGVGIGAQGTVWVVDQTGSQLMGYNPARPFLDRVNPKYIKMGYSLESTIPYTYSDFTGSQMSLAMPSEGSYSKTITPSSPCPAGKQRRWLRIVWKGFIPASSTGPLNLRMEFAGATSRDVNLSSSSSTSGACASFLAAAEDVTTGGIVIGQRRESCIDVGVVSPFMKLEFKFSSSASSSYTYSPQLEGFQIGSSCD